MSISLSLVLGSGGARGYAHIGVIEECLRRGYHIEAISGSSMGALVGGMYAAGSLSAYRDWVTRLSRMDVLRLMDFTWSKGAIRGDKIFHALKELTGDIRIEALPVSFTAVATDLVNQKEIWFQRGELLEAVRASVAVPGFFTPVVQGKRVLVDGGVLNPLPIIPVVAAQSDLIVAVDLNASQYRLPMVELPENPAGEAHEFDHWRLQEHSREAAALRDNTPRGRLDILLNSVEVMQASLSEYKIAGYPPDLLINVPKEACRFHDFHRARDVIEVGRQLAREAFTQLEDQLR